MFNKYMDLIRKPADLRPIGLYRFGLGIIILAHIMRWAPHWAELFSNEGFHVGRFAHWAPTPNTCYVLAVLISISTIMMTIGVFTRTSTGVTLIIFAFLYALDRVNERALSSIILVNLSIGFFSPWGDYFSLSSWRKCRKDDSTIKKLGSPLSIRLWQVQLLQMYFFAGIMKTMYPGWLNGEVLRQIFMGRWARAPGLWLSKILPDVVYPFLTIGALTFEILLPFLLLWPKTRPFGVIAGLLFHLSIEVTLHIEFLGFHSMLCLIIFFGHLDLGRSGKSYFY